MSNSDSMVFKGIGLFSIDFLQQEISMPYFGKKKKGRGNGYWDRAINTLPFMGIVGHFMERIAVDVERGWL